MASLMHVCKWTEYGWIPISAEEARKVAAYSGLFMCALCHQYVTFANGQKNVPHFRHQSKEADKSCPERVFGNASSVGSYNLSDRSLPLRIVVTNVQYHFEIGFPCPPTSVIKNLRGDSIRINLKDQNSIPFQYRISDWFLDDGITWLSVGNTPSAGYVISSVYDACDNRLKFYWPSFVQGIDRWGAVFDATSGKILSQDADVQIEKNYYVLLQSPLTFVPKSVICCKIACNNETWPLYRIKGLDFSEETAKFFLRFGCRLTKTPLFIQQIWPIYIEDPYIIRHEKAKLWFYLQGDEIESKIYPNAPQKSFKCENGQVIQINTYDRQQIISVGRSKMMEYTYLWRDTLKQTTSIPVVSALTLKDEVISPGVANKLPEKGVLHILSSQYDGTISIFRSGIPVEKRPLKAGEPCEITSIRFETEICVKIGLDCVWSVAFHRTQGENNQSDFDLLKQLVKGTGPLRTVPHSLGALTTRLYSYPKVRQWLYRKIREGFMPESSYRLLQRWILKNNRQGEG